MPELLIDNIISIGESEILYYDKEKRVCKINLLMCHKNWKNEMSERKFNFFRRKQPKCVGIRKLLIEKPYYQFWNLEKTKFIYFGTFSEDERYRVCREIENQLLHHGWCTMDYC